MNKEQAAAVSMMAMLFSLACMMAIAMLMSGQPDELTAMESEYCDMVGIWLADNRPPEQRDGWPDFNNNYGAMCAGRE